METEEVEISITDRINEAALARDGALLIQLEDQKRIANAQDFADEVSDLRDRQAEIKLGRQCALTESQAYEAQLVIAGEQLRQAADVYNDRRSELAEIQLKLGVNDIRISSLREESEEIATQLNALLASRNGGKNL